jgi:hypothetical protein
MPGWTAAFSADCSYGNWRFALAKKVADVPGILDKALV